MTSHMREVLKALVAARAVETPVVYTSLVETRGSTPQKAGAAMLVYADGRQVGTLGGGCVEAEVKRKALEQLHTGKSEIVTFQLNHDYGWDDGLICGGRMTMLIAPVLDEQSDRYYQDYLNLVEQADGCLEAIAIDAGDLSACHRFLFDHQQKLISSVGDSNPTPHLIERLPDLSVRPKAFVAAGIAYLPQLQRADLIIVGAGHVGRELARYAKEVDFRVTVIDDREKFCNEENVPWADDWIVGEFAEKLPNLNISSQTYCVIVTRGHNHDEEALLHLIQKQPGFLGMIGSKRKIRLIFDDLMRQGIAAEALEKVAAPIGLEIGSQTVPEIAISIVAQLIQERNTSHKKTPEAKTAPACEN